MKPKLVVFVDSEIWPNLILELHRQNIRLSILNARITEKTFKRWMIIKQTAKKIFNCFDLCLASDNLSKENLIKLNAKNIKTFGNIKLALSIKINEIFNQNEKILAEKSYWCAASTHKGEELFCLRTHLILKKKFKDLITIIIPRHISRSKQIEKICKKMKLSTQILNDKELIKRNKEVVVINSFGVLKKYLKYSRSVFIGKSILKRLQNDSGQNPIEAAKLNCKIYHGPYVSNFKEIYSFLGKNKISEKINNEKELANKLTYDFKVSNHINTSKIKLINDLGQKILKKSTNEIGKMINL